MKDQSNRVRLTAGRVSDFTCPPGKSQAFLWDSDVPTLALRATPTGRKTFVFEGRLNGATVRMSIGTKQPFGSASRRHLSDLAFNREAHADCSKTDRYGREVCRVLVDGVDVCLAANSGRYGVALQAVCQGADASSPRAVCGGGGGGAGRAAGVVG